MNFKAVIYILGWILNIEAVFLVLPCITALIYRETKGFAFVAVMILCFLLGRFLTLKANRAPSQVPDVLDMLLL